MSTTFNVAASYGLLQWPIPTPPQDNFGFIRDALNAVRTRSGTSFILNLGDASFNIGDFSSPTFVTVNKVKTQTGWVKATNGPNTLARFGAKSVVFQGLAGGTAITGNARIYAGQSDRSSGVPTAMTLNNINLPYSAASGYILQSGDKVYASGALSAINSRIGTVSLDNVVFSGSHSGAVGSGGGAPFGNYMDVAVVTSLTFNNINVALTGQGGQFSPGVSRFDNAPETYGSAFLLANGPQITVTNSTFDEGRYRNSLSLWGASGFETNVTISGNLFTRTLNKAIRTAGETLSRVSGTVINNEFQEGAYLDLRNLNLPSSSTSILAISGGNTFSLLQGGYGIIVRNDQTAANLAKLVIQGNSFDGGLAVVNEISTPGSVLSFATATNDVNEITFDSLQVGGAGGDTVTGTDGTDWISGGDGADTLTGDATIGDSSFDAFVFAKVGTADKITDYSGTGGDGDQIWLDDAAFTGLATVDGPTTFLRQLASSDYGTDFVSDKHIIYNGNALWYDADGSGIGAAVKITDFDPAASPAPLASDILIF